MMNRYFKIFVLPAFFVVAVASATQEVHEVYLSSLEGRLWQFVNDGKTVADLPSRDFWMLGFWLYNRDPRAEAIFDGLYKNQTGCFYYNSADIDTPGNVQ